MSVVAVFKTDRDGFNFEHRTYRMQVEGLFLHKKGWHTLLDFDLRVSDKSAKLLNERYVAHWNRDDNREAQV